MLLVLQTSSQININLILSTYGQKDGTLIVFLDLPQYECYNISCRMTTRDENEENSTLMVFLALPGQLFLRLLSALALPLILPKVVNPPLVSFVQFILKFFTPIFQS